MIVGVNTFLTQAVEEGFNMPKASTESGRERRNPLTPLPPAPSAFPLSRSEQIIVEETEVEDNPGTPKTESEFPDTPV